MVVLLGRVWERTMKLVVASSSCSGMASRELMEEAMVIGSMLGRELNSSNLWDSLISNTLGSLKHLASLGRVDLVRESLWNEGGGGGLCTEGSVGSSASTGMDSDLGGAEGLDSRRRLLAAHACMFTGLGWKHKQPLRQ